MVVTQAGPLQEEPELAVGEEPGGTGAGGFHFSNVADPATVHGMDIVNKSKRPLVVPLPGGKKLHLGFRATGQIPDGAVDHPPLKKMLDAGEIALAGESSHGPRGSAPSDEGISSQVRSTSRNLPRSGER